MPLHLLTNRTVRSSSSPARGADVLRSSSSCSIPWRLAGSVRLDSLYDVAQLTSCRHLPTLVRRFLFHLKYNWKGRTASTRRTTRPCSGTLLSSLRSFFSRSSCFSLSFRSPAVGPSSEIPASLKPRHRSDHLANRLRRPSDPLRLLHPQHRHRSDDPLRRRLD